MSPHAPPLSVNSYMRKLAMPAAEGEERGELEEDEDLIFLDFGGTKRHPRGTKTRAAVGTKTPPA